MLRVLQFDGDNVREISMEDMDFHKQKWLDCHDLTKEEFKDVKDLLKLPENELARAMDENERPSITELEHFSMVIFKGPFKVGHTFRTSSFTMLVSNNLLITFRRRELKGLEKVWDLEDHGREKIFKKGTSYIAYQILEKVMDDYFEILDDIEKEINAIEKDVFDKADKQTVINIFGMRKTLIYFHKSLATNRDVISSVDKEYAEMIDEHQIKNFRYVYDDIVQLIDMVATYRDILTGSLDIYLSSVSNNLNKIIKRMTAFGSIILVPTFITGLYGMNFKSMPEIYWPYGYLFAWGTIVLSVVILVVIFKKKDWF